MGGGGGVSAHQRQRLVGAQRQAKGDEGAQNSGERECLYSGGACLGGVALGEGSGDQGGGGGGQKVEDDKGEGKYGGIDSQSCQGV